MSTKTAILLYGYTRTYKTTGKSLLQKVAEPNNADIFIFCWDNAGVSNVIGNANAVEINHYKKEQSKEEDNQGEIVTFECLKNVYKDKLKRVSIQKYNDTKFITDSKGVLSPILPIERIYSLYFNITGVMNLLLDYEKETGEQYDKIILARPDLQFYSAINLNDFDINYLNIANYGGNINPNGKSELYFTCYYKNVERNEYIPCNEIAFSDQLIISSHKNMENLCNLYDMLAEYNNRKLPVCHPETVLYYHLALQQNLKVKTNDIKYEILRTNFSKAENTFTLSNNNLVKNTNKKEKYKNKIITNIKDITLGIKSIFKILVNIIKYSIASIGGGVKPL